MVDGVMSSILFLMTMMMMMGRDMETCTVLV